MLSAKGSYRALERNLGARPCRLARHPQCRSFSNNSAVATGLKRCSPSSRPPAQLLRAVPEAEQPSSSPAATQQDAESSPHIPSSSAPGSAGSALPAVGGAAVAFGAALFLATRVLNAGPSLASLESNSIPLDQALTNGKPTVLEFYASWCEVCRELVPTEYAVQQGHKDSVNFVMLNIDNPKWGPEVSDFRVNGIPHFVFFDEHGTPLSAAVGRLPAEVLEGNTNALAQHTPLPYTSVREQASRVDAAPASAIRSVGPRDHA